MIFVPVENNFDQTRIVRGTMNFLISFEGGSLISVKGGNVIFSSEDTHYFLPKKTSFGCKSELICNCRCGRHYHNHY